MGAILYKQNVYGSGGGGSGASAITDLTDVDISSPSNGEVLKYNSSTQKWENEEESSGASAVSDLTDVNLSNLADGQILKYDATNQEWVNANESGGGGTSERYSRTSLWTGTVQSATEITLSDSIENYDAIEFTTKINTNGAYNCIIVDAKTFSTKYPYASSVSANIPHYCLLGYDNLFGRVITGSTTSKLYAWDFASSLRLVEVSGIKYGVGGGSDNEIVSITGGDNTTSRTFTFSKTPKHIAVTYDSADSSPWQGHWEFTWGDELAFGFCNQKSPSAGTGATIVRAKIVYGADDKSFIITGANAFQAWNQSGSIRGGFMFVEY